MSRVVEILVAAAIAALPFGLVTVTSLASNDVLLPPPRRSSAVSVEEALARRRSVRDFSAAHLSLDDAAQLLWAAQGITQSSGLRTAPSAGALYPLEVYLVAGEVEALPPGVYRYDPRAHHLAPGVSGDRRRALAAAAYHQTWIADAPGIFVIAAVFRRTTIKYGERGERYVHIEAGHAGENLCLQAAALGLGTTIVGAFSNAEVGRILDLSEAEPILIIPVGKPR